ncbi:ubiquitin ligase e3 alpha-related [Anaeramoeba flamelloides]|uniref:E3 ubiquitin-protein ligase n=1 Tax=Anaeramoeba flamelloides TaxID=1746091 RepID=A0ABQ8YP03_9EUKA|nr:ubiquitin ligase e3 alpha-related [Anaeramoeba flamelloides]
MDYSFLLQSNKYESTKKILQSNESLSSFLTYLAKNYTTIDEYLEWVDFLLTASANPKEFYQELSEEGKKNSGCCNKFWKGDTWFYDCKTCELDSTSCICIECFQNGDHEGHDYRLKKGSVGMCDCGDVQSWKPSGFCKYHKGPPKHPENLLEKEFRKRFELILPNILQLLNEKINERVDNAKKACYSQKNRLSKAELHLFVSKVLKIYDSPTEDTIKLIKFLEILNIGGAGTRRIGSKIMNEYHPTLIIKNLNEENKSGENKENKTHKFKKKKSFLYNFMKYANYERGKIFHTIRSFFYKMIIDPEFKFHFTVNYLKLFPKMMYRITIYANSTKELTEFSVQLFTVPATVDKLCMEYNYLEIFFHTIIKIMEFAMIPDPNNSNLKILDAKHFIIRERKLFRILKDLRFVFTNVWVCQYILIKKTQIFELFLTFYSMFQANDQIKKIVIMPEEFYEDNLSHKIYYLDYHSYIINNLLVKGLLCGEEEIDKSMRNINEIQFLTITNSIFQKFVNLINLIMKFILNWENNLPASNNDLKEKFFLLNNSLSNNINNYLYKIFDFNYANNSISFHYPLHRLLGLFLSTILKISNNDSKAINLKSIFNNSILNKNIEENDFDRYNNDNNNNDNNDDDDDDERIMEMEIKEEMGMEIEKEDKEEKDEKEEIKVDEKDEKVKCKFHKNSINFLPIMIHVIRIQSIFSEIRLNLWKKNGESIVKHEYLYRSTFLNRNPVDYDLFLLQVGIILMKPESFLLNCLNEFKLLDYITLGKPETFQIGNEYNNEDDKTSIEEGDDDEDDDGDDEGNNNDVSTLLNHINNLIDVNHTNYLNNRGTNINIFLNHLNELINYRENLHTFINHMNNVINNDNDNDNNINDNNNNDNNNNNNDNNTNTTNNNTNTTDNNTNTTNNNINTDININNTNNNILPNNNNINNNNNNNNDNDNDNDNDNNNNNNNNNKDRKIIDEILHEKTLITVNFLRLIIKLLCERKNTSIMTAKEKLKREIIHILAIKPHMFSSILKLLPDELINKVDEKAIEEIIFEVAHHINKNKNIISLKNEYWKCFEGNYYPYYSVEHTQLSEENYYKYLEIENKNRSKEKQLLKIQPLPIYKKTLDSFKKLPKIINNHLFHQILFTLLYDSVHREGIYNEELLEVILHCIYLILTIPYNHKIESFKMNDKETFNNNENDYIYTLKNKNNSFNDIQFPHSTNFFINSTHDIQTLNGEYNFISLLIIIFQDEKRKNFHLLIKNILNILTKSNDKCKKYILNKFGNILNISNDEKKEKRLEKRKRLIREKQKRMMEEMNIKKNNLLKKMFNENEKNGNDKEKESNEDDEKEEGTFETKFNSNNEEKQKFSTSLKDQEYSHLSFDEHCKYLACSLCHETLSNSTEKSMGLMAFITEQNQIIKKATFAIEDLFCLGRSHLIHVECYQQYFNNLVKREYDQQWYEGMGIINLSKFEFLNPVDRNLVNTIIPLIIFPNNELNEKGNINKDVKNNTIDHNNIVGNENENENEKFNLNKNNDDNKGDKFEKDKVNEKKKKGGGTENNANVEEGGREYINQNGNEREIEIDVEEVNENENLNEKIKIKLTMNFKKDLFKNSIKNLTYYIKGDIKLKSQSILKNDDLFETINSFIGRLGMIKSDKSILDPEETENGFFTLINLFANTMTSFELLTRIEENSKLNSVNRFLLQALLRNCIIFGKRNFNNKNINSNIKREIWDFIINCIPTENFSNLYNINLFNLAIQIYCMLSNEIRNKKLFFHIIRLILPLFLLQIIKKLGFMKIQNENKQLNDLNTLNFQKTDIVSIQNYLIPFLRSLLLFYLACIKQKNNNSIPLDLFDYDNYQTLCKLLKLPTDFQLILKSEILIEIYNKWEQQDSQNNAIQLKRLVPIKKFHLFLDLPEKYIDLFHTVQKIQYRPKKIAICLLTGEILKINSKESCPYNSVRKHCIQMGGHGLCLAITGDSASGILLCDPALGIIKINGFYLDKWNEPDRGLRRGGKLLFNKNKFIDLLISYFNHELIDKITVKKKRRRNNLLL